MAIKILTMFVLASISILSEVPEKADNHYYSPVDSNISRGDPHPARFIKKTTRLNSSIVGDTFKIHISLPALYYASDDNYPVIYCTDADRGFDMLSNIVNLLSFPTGEIPPMIVVGIGYSFKEDEGLEVWGAKRHRDLTPTFVPENDSSWQKTLAQISGRDDITVISGGADRFLQFIKQELIPYIEQNYRVNSSDRAIFGYSLGGLFSLYTMFHSPETFQKYFAGSPSIWWDDKTLFRDEDEYAAQHDDLPVNLFMSAGSLESSVMIGQMKEMEEYLEYRDYPALQMETMIFPGETHNSSCPAAFTRALRVLYKPGQ